MSSLDQDSLKHLCKLCRLDLPDERLVQLVEDLKGILDYAELLKEVDVSDLSPFSHMEEHGIGSLREDEVHNVLTREEFLDNAPDQVGGMIRVPPVIRKDV